MMLDDAVEVPSIDRQNLSENLPQLPTWLSGNNEYSTAVKLLLIHLISLYMVCDVRIPAEPQNLVNNLDYATFSVSE